MCFFLRDIWFGEAGDHIAVNDQTTADVLYEPSLQFYELIRAGSPFSGQKIKSDARNDPKKCPSIWLGEP